LFSDFWRFQIFQGRESSTTKLIKIVEQAVPKHLIELSPALFGGVQLR
jgi:hypothetical protein